MHRDMDDIASWIWVLIPLAAILAGTFSEWVKVRAKQRNLGASTDELERIVERLRAEGLERQESLERRIANLETILTSQTWDTLQNPNLSAEEKRLLTNDAGATIRDLQRDLSDTERAELLARRLK